MKLFLTNATSICSYGETNLYSCTNYNKNNKDFRSTTNQLQGRAALHPRCVAKINILSQTSNAQEFNLLRRTCH
jgi:hypothetical protein